ncbi:MAG TPA: DNA polymerase IV [Spirochaetia bacterium]|nr:DNA polymerase IV [Spirochaetia bacterium]
MQVIFHVDMDAFFASVEQMDHPEYAGKPVIVGAAPGHRGVVSACSYEARRFGVHSAMPVVEAYRRCPNGIYLPVRMQRYHEVSSRIMTIFGDYSPLVQQMSVDEAFLDMTGTERLFGSPAACGKRLKEDVRSREGLAISVGIAPNRYLAKLASAYSKPDGLYEVAPGDEEAFVSRLRLKDLWGVGKRTLEHLLAEGIQTISDLKELTEPELKKLFGESAGSYLYGICRGIDPGMFTGDPKSRSISAETTFEHDIEDREIVVRSLLDLCHTVMFRLLHEGFRSRTIGIKLRLWDFSTSNAQTTLSRPLVSAEQAHRAVLELLDKRWDGKTAVRLVGVSCARLESEGSEEQPELFPEDDDRNRRVEKAVLNLKERYGSLPVRKASLMKRPDQEKNDS